MDQVNSVTAAFVIGVPLITWSVESLNHKNKSSSRQVCVAWDRDAAEAVVERNT